MGSWSPSGARRLPKGVVDVSASFDGVSFGAPQLFTYELPPAVTEAVLEDDQLLVRGSGFVNTSALSCRVDGMDVRATYVSDKKLCAIRASPETLPYRTTGGPSRPVMQWRGAPPSPSRTPHLDARPQKAVRLFA